jgi:nucleotide-binding universal stress UspA family protein
MTDFIQRIVVATDFSDHAEQAVRRAVQLAAAHGSILEIVHAAPMPAPMPVWGDMAGGTWLADDELMAGAGRRLERQREALQAEYGITVTVHCESGPVARLVHQRCEAMKTSLLVIGATGEGTVARRLFGSSAQSIVRGARCPVLVVRLPVVGSYEHVLVASDFSDDAERAGRLSHMLAPQARLSLFGALDQPKVTAGWFEGLDDATRHANLERARVQARARLRELAGRLGQPDALVHVRDGRASHELAGVLADSDAQLLSVGAHGKSRLEAGLLGSTSLHAVTEAGCDVLVVPVAR